MLRQNEFNLESGVYRHYKGSLYVVVNIVTHAENPALGKMEALADPLVCYRDLQGVTRHLNGRMQPVHQVYMRTLSEFTAQVDLGHGITVQRFTKE